MKILFVCTGNVCRSFTAQKLFEKMMKGSNNCAKSCGVMAESYFRVPSKLAALLEKEGISAEGHRPSLISEELVNWADVLLVMEDAQKKHITAKFPQGGRKTHLLTVFSNHGTGDIADPMGRDEKAYAAMICEVKACLQSMNSRFA